jgi:four helix bundle protein
MRYTRFEDLPVWNSAIDLAVEVYEMTSNPIFSNRYSLKDQIERAAVSVSNNIAEGFERGTTQELLTFIYIARGSAGEVRSMLCLFERLAVFTNFKSEISNLKSKAEGISRQLRGWAAALQNSKIRGQRYLTQNSKRHDQAAREREEFLNELAEIRARSKSRINP